MLIEGVDGPGPDGIDLFALERLHFAFARDAQDRLQIPLLKNKYYFDEAYNYLFVKPAYWFAENVVYKLMDQGLIDGILHIFGPVTDRIGAFIRNKFDLPVINRFIKSYRPAMRANIFWTCWGSWSINPW